MKTVLQKYNDRFENKAKVSEISRNGRYVTFCSLSMYNVYLISDVMDYILFVWLFFFLSHSRIFYSYGDLTITGKGLQILTNARNSWPLSSEGSLACHTYCDTGYPCIMVISEDPWHSHIHLLLSIWQWSSHYLFLQLRSVAAGIRTTNLTLVRRTFLPTAPPPRHYYGLRV